MFRTFSRRLLMGNKTILISSNGYMQKTPRRPKEINIVKLMGTIEHEVKRLENGTINLYLKTLNEDTTYCVHKVAIANRNLLKIVQNHLKVNQRIYIGGKLRTENVITNGKRYQNVEVMANEIYLLESNSQIGDNQSPIQIDENYVEMLAFVSTQIRNMNNFSVFCLATHFTKLKGAAEESEGKDYHKVSIYNNPELLAIARNLQKFDRVYLTGFINYSSQITEGDGDYSNGYIQPTSLTKLTKFK